MKRAYCLAIMIAMLSEIVAYSADIPDFLDDAKGEVSVILRLKDDSGNFGAGLLRKYHDLPEQDRHRMLIEEMKNVARQSQFSLLNEIEANIKYVREYESFWISNVVYLKAEAGFIRRICGRDEVEQVYEDLPLLLIEPVDSDISSDFVSGIEEGLEIVGARTAWEMGLTGEGSIVCSFDTGVDGGHPALGPSWRGLNGASSAESWFDPFTNTDFPFDTHGHGSHTMGTMVGIAGADTVGVAIGAQWIAAAVVDRGGGVQRTIADILLAFQWAADPDGDPSTSSDMPDVINNSWGVPIGYLGPCDATFWDAMDNLEALGVVSVFAAGNEGPFASSIRTPADRIATQYNSFAVGALNSQTLEIAPFSSRGPSGCDSITIKPEITAPGVNIRSCDNGGGYITMSGTSMATPHISGAVAILRQFNPQASADQIKQALMAGAIDLGPPGEDNSYGHGLLNILNALYNMPPPERPYVHVLSMGIVDGNNGQPEPGETIRFEITIENIGGRSDIHGELTSQHPGIAVVEGLADLGNIGHLDTVSSTAFVVNIPDDLLEGQTVSFEIEFYGDGWLQIYAFSIVIVGPTEPALATITTDNLQMSFSDVGQFGLGQGSINPSGGAGFRYPADGEDFMYEAALLITAAGRVSDGARTMYGMPDNDFSPLSGGGPVIMNPGLYSDHDGYAAYSDSAAEEPLGLIITQRCFAWDGPFKFITLEFVIKNISGAPLTDIRAGIFCDWDMPLFSGMDDIVDYDGALSLGYVQDISSGWCVGLKAITSPASSYRAIDNQHDLADGFSEEQKIQFMSEGFVQTQYLAPANYSHLLSIGPYDIADNDSEVVAFALVIGESVDEIRYQAQQSFWMYPGMTDIDDNDIQLPSEFSLLQNYPNPFNNSTVIELRLTHPAELTIYDIAGRQVRKFDIDKPGMTRLIWNGRNDDGLKAVSGVYFYRLTSNGQNVVRRMVLLK